MTYTYVGQKLKNNAHYICYLHIFISWKKKGGQCIKYIFDLLHTSSDMMTINFDTITNNYEVIFVIKTDEILLKQNRYEFSSASSKYDSTFIC